MYKYTQIILHFDTVNSPATCREDYKYYNDNTNPNYISQVSLKS